MWTAGGFVPHWPKQLAHTGCQSLPVVKNRQLLQQLLVQIFKHTLGFAELFFCLRDRREVEAPSVTLTPLLSLPRPESSSASGL